MVCQIERLSLNFLCFLRAGESIYISDIEAWNAGNPGGFVEYVFISYTSEKFNTDVETALLHEVEEEHAARKAGVPAYWVGCSCLRNDAQKEQSRFAELASRRH